jgi:hypothetical protein
MSLGITGGNSSLNNKSRFIKPINNKNLGKAYNFMDKSPLSRASLVGGMGNLSLISHYYN